MLPAGPRDLAVADPDRAEGHASARLHSGIGAAIWSQAFNDQAWKPAREHGDPGVTLRVYTHLMPSSEARTRKAISAMYRAAGHAHDGPGTAQAA